MTALLEPEADQLADGQARRLLELAGEYVRGALQVPSNSTTCARSRLRRCWRSPCCAWTCNA